MGTERVLHLRCVTRLTFCLYAAVSRVGHCANLLPRFFSIYSETLRRYSYTPTITGQDARVRFRSRPGFYLFSCRLEVSARGRGYRFGLLRRRGDILSLWRPPFSPNRCHIPLAYQLSIPLTEPLPTPTFSPSINPNKKAWRPRIHIHPKAPGPYQSSWK